MRPTLLVNGTTALSIPILSGYVLFTGSGYPPNTPVYLVLIDTATNAFSFITAIADASGSINYFAAPTGFTVTLRSGIGTYTVISTLTMPTATTFTAPIASASLTLANMGVTVSVTSNTGNAIPYGASFTTTGTGFIPNSVIFPVFLNTANNAFSKGFLGFALVTDAMGVLRETINTLEIPVIQQNGRGSYVVIITLSDSATTPPFGEIARAAFTVT